MGRWANDDQRGNISISYVTAPDIGLLSLMRRRGLTSPMLIIYAIVGGIALAKFLIYLSQVPVRSGNY
jgi:hypothetical protein